MLDFRLLGEMVSKVYEKIRQLIDNYGYKYITTKNFLILRISKKGKINELFIQW